MTPNVRGAVGAVAKLRHAADERAKILIERVGAADTRDAAAHKAVHGQLDELEKATAEMEQLSSDLAGSNGGPTLDGSGQPLPEPQKSWSGGGQG